MYKDLNGQARLFPVTQREAFAVRVGLFIAHQEMDQFDYTKILLLPYD